MIETKVSFIERLSSLWRLKCTSMIEKGPQSVSFIERDFFCVWYIQAEGDTLAACG